MLNWVTANLSTIVVSAILLAIIIAISTYHIRQRKRGSLKIPIPTICCLFPGEENLQ